MFVESGWPGYAEGTAVYDIDGGKDARFHVPVYTPTVAGADDPNRNYKSRGYYMDASRTHLVYEAGWPTTAGVDYDLRVHQFTPNEQNLNDFIIVEVSLTNTGEVDTNADGVVDGSGNAIDALAAVVRGENCPVDPDWIWGRAASRPGRRKPVWGGQVSRLCRIG